MQLINSAIYDKDAQARAKAMEESRKAKAQKRTQVEQAKVLSYAKGVGGQYPPPAAATSRATAQPAGYQVFFNDIPFRIGRGGSKLIRVSSAHSLFFFCYRKIEAWGISLPGVLDDPNTANNTPKRVSIAGVTFVRSKNGNLHRLGAVTSKRWLFLSSRAQNQRLTIYTGNRQLSRRMNFARDLLRRVPHPSGGLLISFTLFDLGSFGFY